MNRLGTVATRLETVTTRLEAVANRLETLTNTRASHRVLEIGMNWLPTPCIL